MIRKKQIQNLQDRRPVALYSVEKKAIIGIFLHRQTLLKYLFGHNVSNGNETHVSQCLYRHNRIKKCDLNTVVTCRFANKEQIDLLGTRNHLMLDESFKKFIPATRII